MSNFKHTIMAVSAVAIIGSLFISQLGEFISRPVDAELLSHGTRASIQINPEAEEFENTENETDNTDSDTDNNADSPEKIVETEEFADVTETMSEEELNELIEKKSEQQTNYVKLTSGTLTVRENPSEESVVVDNLECKSEVKVLSASEGWTTIEYDGGKVGYVQSKTVTESKEEAEFASKYYDNYVVGTVTTQNGGAVRIRKGPSTSTGILGQMENGEEVLLLWNDKDFVKVLYGEEYKEGYIVASALTLNDKWVAKSHVEKVRAEVQRKKEEEAARKKAEEEAKKRAQEAAKKKSAQAAAKASAKASAPKAVSNAPASSKGQAIVNEAKKYLGIKYVYGGSTPKGFDCSGLVKYVCAKNGISLSRTSAAQSRQGVTVSKSNLQPGDLLFFAKNGRVHHVGIYVGNGQMIHAPHTGSYVKYDSINTAYRQREFYCAKRVY